MTSAHMDSEAAAVAAIIRAGRFAAERDWVPATSGNFSVRVDAARIAVTKSACDKGALSPGDVMSLALAESLPPGVSAEAPLHVALYMRSPEIGAIFHVHSPNAALYSRLHGGRASVTLRGWELQKAFAGIASHETPVEVPIFANDQDTKGLAKRIDEVLSEPVASGTRAPGYLLAGHGLYAWGASPSDALRHLEAFDALFALELEMMRMSP